MAIELSREARDEAVRSLQRYCESELDHPIGNIAAAGLLGFFLEDIAPLVYNQAVSDVQQRLLERVQELDIEHHEDAFTYWSKRRTAKGR